MQINKEHSLGLTGFLSSAGVSEDWMALARLSLEGLAALLPYTSWTIS